MNERVQKALQSVDRMTLRERLFLFAAVITVLAGTWEALLAGPLAVREQLANAQVESLRQRLDTLNQSITLTAEGMSDGMPSQLDRLRVLRERVAEGEKAMKVFTSDLVDPKQMRFVLEELIAKQTGLRLVSATNLAPKPLFEDPSSAADTETAGAAQPSDAPKLYQHTLVLTLEGTYLDCLTYLRAVERLPWHLYWNRLEFEAGEYPKNTIMIELKTLSLDEEWIGV